jgi:hypothetical protein
MRIQWFAVPDATPPLAGFAETRSGSGPKHEKELRSFCFSPHLCEKERRACARPFLCSALLGVAGWLAFQEACKQAQPPQTQQPWHGMIDVRVA